MSNAKFKVGDWIGWVDKRGNANYSYVEAIIEGPLLPYPIYRTRYGNLVPENIVIKPKLSYDRYEGVVVDWWSDNLINVDFQLHFRDGHGHDKGSVKALVCKILQEHCEVN